VNLLNNSQLNLTGVPARKSCRNFGNALNLPLNEHKAQKAPLNGYWKLNA
jgi:hypothetical protein